MTEKNFDLQDFFSGDTILRVDFKDQVTRHHFREMDSPTDLHYQRRLSKLRSTRMKNGGFVSSDDSLTTEVWLYDQLCHKFEIETAEGLIDVPDFKAKVPTRLKRAAVFAYQTSVREATEEEGKNS